MGVDEVIKVVTETAVILVEGLGAVFDPEERLWS